MFMSLWNQPITQLAWSVRLELLKSLITHPPPLCNYGNSNSTSHLRLSVSRIQETQSILYILFMMAGLEPINEQVLSALQTHSSIRLLGDLPTNELNMEDYLGSVSSMIANFVAVWKETAMTRLLAVEVWSQRTHFALDLNNEKYDYMTAHQEKTILPVYILRFSSRTCTWHIARYPRQDTPLADRIAVLHHANGHSPLPFLEDHTKVITHYTPRSEEQHSQPPSQIL